MRYDLRSSLVLFVNDVYRNVGSTEGEVGDSRNKTRCLKWKQAR
jgi:hypothetical protein